MHFRAVIAALTSLLPLAASAETFRCGKWIIDDETTLPELTQKCGARPRRDSGVEDVRAPNVYTGGNTKVGETVIETWVYEHSARSAAMVVTIVDGQIKKIERLKK